MRFEEYLGYCFDCTRVADLKPLYDNLISEYGFENAVLVSVRNGLVAKVGWYDFPPEYAAAYIDEDWQRVDPILAHSFRATKPFLWDDVIKQSRLTKPNTQFLNASAELGVTSGLSIPIHRPGNAVDLISVSKRKSSTDEIEISQKLVALSSLTFERLRDLTRANVEVPLDVTNLTDRERECLLWCKDGKNNLEIADILQVTEPTVRFHLKNVKDKLGAESKIGAVVTAIQRGII